MHEINIVERERENERFEKTLRRIIKDEPNYINCITVFYFTPESE